MVKNYRIHVNGKQYDVAVEELGSETSPVTKPTSVPVQTPTTPTPVVQPTSKPVAEQKKETAPAGGGANQVSIVAPMAGLVIDVFAKVGQSVNPGDKLLILEAMKMENDIVSDTSGIINSVETSKGDNVETGQVLVTIIKS